MKRSLTWVLMAVVVALVGGAGAYYYVRGRPTAAPQRPRDPGFMVVLSIRTLEREPTTRLSREQIARILPLMKALKDVPLSDVEASAAIARAVREVFTPEQRAALEEAARRLRERAAGAPGARGGGFAPPGAGGVPGGLGGAPGGPGGAPGGVGLTDEEREQRRAQMFERMIRYLERRMKS